MRSNVTLASGKGGTLKKMRSVSKNQADTPSFRMAIMAFIFVNTILK